MNSTMETPKLTPSIIVAAALVVSSLIMSYGMSQLGADIIAAGIHSRQLSVKNTNNAGPLRIILDDDSEVQLNTAPQSID